MSHDKRPRLEKARAVLRLSKEHCVPVEQLCEEANAKTRTLIRWIIEGKRGIHLDGLHNPVLGWESSSLALRRFMDQFAKASQSPHQNKTALVGSEGGAA